MNDKSQERFLRSIGILNSKQLAQLRSTKIAVGGLGLGGSIFLNLVRMGFHDFHIADPDIFERTNINRQRLAKESNIGRRKDECTLREAFDINPDISIKTFPDGVKPHNVDEFLQNVDWVIDVVDLFAMSDKLALNEAANTKGIPVASCATLGFSGSVVVFERGGPTFRELSGIDLANPYSENLQNFLQFICPQVPTYMEEQIAKAMDQSSYIPFVTPGGEISAAFAAAEVTKHVLNIGERVGAPMGIFIDSLQLKLEIFTASHKVRSFNPKERSKQRVA